MQMVTARELKYGETVGLAREKVKYSREGFMKGKGTCLRRWSRGKPFVGGPGLPWRRPAQV